MCFFRIFIIIEKKGGAAVEHEERLGEYTYRWTQDCFPLGADSLALGEFALPRPGDRVLDLGCGAGLLLVLCARRAPGLTLAGVELDPAAAALARENLRDNGLEGEIVTGDLRQWPRRNWADLVVSNPPWYPQGSGRPGGPGRMEECTLAQLCAAAAAAVRGKGRFALVHRPERLTEALVCLRQAGLEPKRLQLCRSRPDKPPYAVLAEAVKGGRPGLEILPDRS